jgi:hypothetical protein
MNPSPRKEAQLNAKIIPDRHADPWVDLLRSYVSGAVEALTLGGLLVERSWLDPMGPRDATILYASSSKITMALVWDEVTGWRHGRYLGGQQGVRTALETPAYLGGGVLLGGRELTRRVISGESRPRHEYRSAEDLRDGLDGTLARLPYQPARE